MLQAIFMELPTLDAAKAAAGTCRRMRDAFHGYERGILWTILSRELGSTLPGTIGALAIFASAQKGNIDEPLLWNLSISVRYWAPMLRKYEEQARKRATRTLANELLAIYRQFPIEIARRPRDRHPNRWCSGCRSFLLPTDQWNPLNDGTNGNCIEHVLQANAVRYRLNCRMVPGFIEPDEPLKDDHDVKKKWDTGPVVRSIMRHVESNSDDETELGDDADWQNDPWYDDDYWYNDNNWYEDRLDPVNDYGYKDVYQGWYPWPRKDKYRQHWQDYFGRETQQKNPFKQEVKVYPEKFLQQKGQVYQEDEIYPEEKIKQELELLEQEEIEIGLWFQSDEAVSIFN